jgi:hypothetical protein
MLTNRMIVPAVAACLMSAPLWAAETADNAAGGGAPGVDSVSGVWADKELNFTYMGFTTRYSCDGLRDKMRGVLLDLGADKKTLKVMESGCTSAAGRPEHFPGVKAKLRIVQPASGRTDDKQTPVPAHWKPVDLKLRNSFNNDSGECELVEQIKQKVLPLFTTRNVELNSNCVPHQASAVRPTLKLEVLVADAPQHPAAEPQASR